MDVGAATNPHDGGRKGYEGAPSAGRPPLLYGVSLPPREDQQKSFRNEIPDSLRERVLQQHETVRGLETGISNITAALKSANDSKAGVEGRLGFREEYLFRWLCNLLGGDTNLIDEISRLERTTESLEEQKGILTGQIKATQGKISAEIDDYLAKTDPRYTAVLQRDAEIKKVITANDRYLTLIDAALSDVTGAQLTEGADLLTGSKMVALLSYVDSCIAKSSIKAVKAEGPRYKRAVEEYGSVALTFKELPGHSDVGDGIDTVLDLGLNGFDFMSIFSLIQLDDAQGALEKLRAAVEGAGKFFAKQAGASDRCKESWRKKIEAACLGTN